MFELGEITSMTVKVADKKLVPKVEVAKVHYLNDIPNLFRPVRRGARAIGREIHLNFDSGTKLDVIMYKELDVADQDLFLAIISLLDNVEITKIVEYDSENKLGKTLRSELKLEKDFINYPILSVNTTINYLLKFMKKPNNKQSYKWCLESLKRLSLTKIFYETKWSKGASTLLSFHLDENTKKLIIGVNPVCANVFLSGAKYNLNNLTERYSFKNDITKALQSYLSRTIDIGKTRTIDIDTIVEKIYGETTQQELLYKRRLFIKKGIKELNDLSKEFKCELIKSGDSTQVYVMRKNIFRNLPI